MLCFLRVEVCMKSLIVYQSWTFGNPSASQGLNIPICENFDRMETSKKISYNLTNTTGATVRWNIYIFGDEIIFKKDII